VWGGGFVVGLVLMVSWVLFFFGVVFLGWVVLVGGLVGRVVARGGGGKLVVREGLWGWGALGFAGGFGVFLGGVFFWVGGCFPWCLVGGEGRGGGGTVFCVWGVSGQAGGLVLGDSGRRGGGTCATLVIRPRSTMAELLGGARPMAPHRHPRFSD